MLCQLRKVKGTIYACSNVGCDRILKLERMKPRELEIECPGIARADEVDPSLARRALNFAVAVVKHTDGGLRTVDEAIYQSRLALCEACPLYRGGYCRHKNCGCGVSKKTWHRKLRWAEQSCPLDPPKWLAVPAVEETDAARCGSRAGAAVDD